MMFVSYTVQVTQTTSARCHLQHGPAWQPAVSKPLSTCSPELSSVPSPSESVTCCQSLCAGEAPLGEPAFELERLAAVLRDANVSISCKECNSV